MRMTRRIGRSRRRRGSCVALVSVLGVGGLLRRARARGRSGRFDRRVRQPHLPVGRARRHRQSRRGSVDRRLLPVRHDQEIRRAVRARPRSPAGAKARADRDRGHRPHGRRRTYHYRIVATNATGTALGADRTLHDAPRSRSRWRSPAQRPTRPRTAAAIPIVGTLSGTGNAGARGAAAGRTRSPTRLASWTSATPSSRSPTALSPSTSSARRRTRSSASSSGNVVSGIVTVQTMRRRDAATAQASGTHQHPKIRFSGHDHPGGAGCPDRLRAARRHDLEGRRRDGRAARRSTASWPSRRRCASAPAASSARSRSRSRARTSPATARRVVRLECDAGRADAPPAAVTAPPPQPRASSSTSRAITIRWICDVPS